MFCRSFLRRAHRCIIDRRPLSADYVRLAAIGLEHGADTVSFDRDFARLPGVKHGLPG
jgi:predicted nucleic acid-binding protein